MGVKGWNVAVLFAIGAILCATSTQREKRLVESLHEDRVALLEEEAAAAPLSADRVERLAQAYLDARQPGMALAAVERAPADLRARRPGLEHLYARALLDQGRSADALAAERRVLASCRETDGAKVQADVSACSSWLVASATRRAEILEQLVQLGIDDMNAHPEASSLAYHNATRQVSFSVR